jgi:hypothetical protein
MAEHEPDGVNETFQSAARVAITAGGLMAERMMRAREQAMRDAQAQSEQHARELQARMDSERAAARAALAPVGRDEWWDRAGAEQIGVAWETANAWRHVDRDAAATVDHLRDQLRGRYAIDPDSLDADPGAVQDALERRERAMPTTRRAPPPCMTAPRHAATPPHRWTASLTTRRSRREWSPTPARRDPPKTRWRRRRDARPRRAARAARAARRGRRRGALTVAAS